MVIELYFSQHFGVSPKVLQDYGAFDVSLASDLPLFVDPFLLFNSKKQEYRDLHDAYLCHRHARTTGPRDRGQSTTCSRARGCNDGAHWYRDLP